ncbi:MAG: HD domain-containing protein [Lachnospiraceae bacterium]|jgi:hypothetical protein|nr:HD domain-containing protein [Lachnospiraceae bacterium]
MNGTQLNSIVDVICHSFRHLNPHLIEHGERVAFILMNMLRDTNYYTQQEKEDIFMLGLFHDIGAFKKEDVDSMLTFDLNDSMEHSVSGYLLFRTFSPLPEYADVILYHHQCNAQYYPVPINNYHRDIAKLIYLADRIDISCILNKTERLETFFQNYDENIFTPFMVDWFLDANAKYHILEKIQSLEYQKELAEYSRCHFSLSRAQIHNYLMTFIFSVNFRNEYAALHTSHALYLSENIADTLHLPPTDCKIVQLAMLLHNIGKITVPSHLTATDDYNQYLTELYRSPTLNVARDILTDADDLQAFQIIEEAFALIKCWFSNTAADSALAPVVEAVALSYVMSDSLTYDLEVSLNDYPQLLTYLKGKYYNCKMDDSMLRTLERDFEQIIANTQSSSKAILHTHNQMMDEHSYLNTIILHYNHYNNKYHPSPTVF